MSKPLAGRLVVVTRPRASSVGLARALRARGARVAFAPLIQTLPPRSWKPLDAAIALLPTFDAAAFASASAVEPFFSRAARACSGRPPRPIYLAAVGAATAAALAARGWRGARVADDSRAEGLAALLRRRLPRGARVLLPRAERGREALPRLLRAGGLRVTAVSAYRTVADPAGRAALRRAVRDGADAVCFASGSAVAAAGRGALPASVAIGPTTAAALKARGRRAAAVAEKPDADSFARAVVRALRGKR